MNNRFSVADMTREDDGFLSFGLYPNPEIAALMPAKAVEDIKKAAGNEWVQARFSAALDCASLNVSLNAAIVDRDDREIQDYDIKLPPDEKRALLKTIDEWCEKEFSQDIIAVADDHVGYCGVKMKIGDYIERMGNMDFAEKEIHAVRQTSNDTEYFGNALVLSFSRGFPDLLENLSRALAENRLTGFVEICPPDGVFDMESVDADDSRLNYAFERVAKSRADEIVENSAEVGRHYPEIFVDPSGKQLITYFRAKDSDEMISDHLSFSEMKKLARDSPETAAKPRM